MVVSFIDCAFDHSELYRALMFSEIESVLYIDPVKGATSKEAVTQLRNFIRKFEIAVKNGYKFRQQL